MKISGSFILQEMIYETGIQFLIAVSKQERVYLNCYQ